MIAALLGTTTTGGSVPLVAEDDMFPIAAMLLGAVGNAAVTSTTMPGVNVVVGAVNDPPAPAEPISVQETEILAVATLPNGTVPVVE